jgi:bacteriocin biosynthesis cyclodehydratase domain-containing protein
LNTNERRIRVLKKPRLKYCFRPEFLKHNRVLLVSEKDRVLISGKFHYMILEEINNYRLSVDELIKKLHKKATAFEVVYTLDDLEKKGYITEAGPELPLETGAFWEGQGLELHTLKQVLQENRVILQSFIPAITSMFQEAFEKGGIHTGNHGILRVVIVDDYGKDELQQINLKAIENKQSWILVKPVGNIIWIGPVFIPGKTGCWECLNQRLELNRPFDFYLKTEKGQKNPAQLPLAYVSHSIQIAANIVTLEVTKWLCLDKSNTLDGKILTIDTNSQTHHTHILVKRPQCKTCGIPDLKKTPKPIILSKTSGHTIFKAGGYREVSPDHTFEKYSHHISPITGVIPKLVPYHNLTEAPIFNYSAGRNIAMKSLSLFWLNQHIRSVNGGKGKNQTQSKVGALGEAIERYSLMYHGDESYIKSNLKELGKDGIHPNVCMNFSEKQFKNREQINQGCHEFYSLVPVPFDESMEMKWTPVYSLTHQKFKYLPSCFCYAQYPSQDELNLFSYPDSNGTAAGNTLGEAILQGFLELVERDCVAMWWYNRLNKQEVDLNSFNSPYFTRVISYYHNLGRSIYAMELTNDLNIPTFVAISLSKREEKEKIIFGFGAHLDAQIAIERALVELNQILPIAEPLNSFSKSTKYLTKDTHFVNWLDTATRENHPYLIPHKDLPQKKALYFQELCPPTIYESVNFCMKSAKENNLETLVLDLTQPDVGLNVVRVIVPELRHFWKRLGPGRLFEVPIKMGWLDKPIKEEQLNPIGLFI